MFDEGVSQLIADIYAGTRDRAVWDRAMDVVAERLDAAWMMVAAFDFETRSPVAPSFYRVSNGRFMDAMDEYADAQFRDDPTNRFVALNPAGGVFDSFRHTDERDEAYLRWNADRLGSAGWRLLHSGRDATRIGLSLHRGANRGPLDQAEGALLALIFTHLREAADLIARPPLLDGVDPILLVAADGRMLHANDAARAWFDTALQLVDGRPLPLARSGAAAFRAVVRAALDGRGGGVARLDRADGAPAYARVTPLPPGHGPLPTLAPRAVIRLIDPAAAPRDRRIEWRALFGLTPAEARLADTLVRGPGMLKDVAGTLGLAHATARNQLAGLLAKTGTNSQVALVRLLSRFD